MAYSPSGVVDTKYSPETGTDIIFGYTQGYNNSAFYSHQPQMAYSSTEEDIMMFRWDWNGQLTHIGRPYTEQFRRHVWNEAGQLAAAFGNEYCGYYAYDAKGNRAYKLTGSVVVDQYNGGYIYASAYFDEATMYVNPYMVVTRRGYTKHYYNGSQRIASRLGDNLGDGNTFVRDDDLTALLDTAKSLWNNMTYVWEPSHQDMQDDEQFIDVAGNSLPIHRYGPYIGEISSCLYDADIFSYVFWGDFHLTDDTDGEGLFFYHSDHLGSANWVTNSQGQAVQYIHYMPYGELWENQQAFEYDERFKFTGKERDTETGYDYFGARYYLSLLGIWLSPDPLLDKYPSISSYAYCKWNPLKYMDPNGKLVWPVLPKYNGYGRRHENNYGAPRPNGRTHAGVDINHTGGGNTDLGAPIIATHDGVVVSIKTIGNGDKDAGGNRITIVSGDGSVSTSYMHLDMISNNMQEGSIVQEGQQIGTMGGSGKGVSDRYTSHLHYELRIDGQLVNPAISPSELIDPQRLIENDIEGGTLPEILVVGEKQNRPIPNLNIE